MKELLEDETLKDLDIKVRGDKIVRCHKYVLAATSSKWEQLLHSSQGMLLQNYLVFSLEIYVFAYDLILMHLMIDILFFLI